MLENYGFFNSAFCNKSFAGKYTLRDHMVIHTGEKPFDCNICGRAFFKKSNLAEHHTRIHSEERPYKCGSCDEKFKFKKDLKNHSFAHTEDNPYKCDTCGDSFGKKYQLTAHLRRFHQKKPTESYDCRICKQTFGSKYKCKKHMQIHTVESLKKSYLPYKCENCNSYFTNLGRGQQPIFLKL